MIKGSTCIPVDMLLMVAIRFLTGCENNLLDDSNTDKV